MKFLCILIVFVGFVNCSETTKTEKKNSEQESRNIIELATPPYTKDPFILQGNKLYFDSVKPFFKFKDVERLDILCKKMIDWHKQGLKELVFNSKKIKPELSKDTIYFSDYQFLVGNVKKDDDMINNILIILDYREAWGMHLKLITINSQGKILDIENICDNYGDGGQFVNSTLYHINKFNYKYTVSDYYETITEPTDTIKSFITTGTFTISKEGVYSNKIISQDSNYQIIKVPVNQELKTFWENNLLPIINKDRRKLEQVVHFPLEGEWGNVIELNKPRTDWTKADFFNNLDQLFYPELIEKLKSQNYKNINVINHPGFTELLVTTSFEEMIDDSKAESAVILRFKQFKGKWKLYAYQIAG